MVDNFYKITYESFNNTVEYKNFDKHDLDSATATLLKLKANGYKNVKLFNVVTNELELKEDEILL